MKSPTKNRDFGKGGGAKLWDHFSKWVELSEKALGLKPGLGIW